MEETLIKRSMPNSLDAEQSVIGSMIMDKDAILTAMEMLTSDDFYHKQYGILFDAMIELYSKGLPVDLITLQNKLKEKEVPEEISSLSYVKELLDAVPTSANIKYYAKIVKDNSMRRRLIRLNEEIENECYAGRESVDKVMASWSAAPINSRQECMAVMGMPMSMVRMGRLADNREPKVEPPGRSDRFMKI